MSSQEAVLQGINELCLKLGLSYKNGTSFNMTTMTSTDFCTFNTIIVVIPFRTFRTDLTEYHTFLTLHPSATFTIHDSV